MLILWKMDVPRIWMVMPCINHVHIGCRDVSPMPGWGSFSTPTTVRWAFNTGCFTSVAVGVPTAPLCRRGGWSTRSTSAGSIADRLCIC